MEPLPWGRLSGCRADGLVCVKDTSDCTWSVALSQNAVTEGRHIWEARVRGRTGRMSIGVAKCVDEVLRPSGAGWISPACEGNVWYYSSTGSLRDGPKLIQETGVKFGDGDVIMLDVNMDSGELRMERGGAEQLPVISGLSGAVHVCVAMFFNGACCELRELSLSGGHYKSPYLAAPGLPLAGSVPGVSRTSSVPRLALKDVGEGAPGSSKSVKEAAAPDPTSSTAPNGASSQPSVPAPPSDTATAAMVSGSARPSPRLAGIPVLSGPPGGPHRLLTPRTLALSEGTGMPACPERPSPQGTPRTVSSPRGALVSLCPAGMYPSPRYVSPRTPRSIQQPSPRKPEAVPATLTISQHKELDSAMRRVETLEEHLSVTLAENRRLQDALTRALGRPAAPPSDANGELDADARPDPPPPAGSGPAKRLHLSDEPPASGRGAGPETPPQVADGAGGAGAGPARVEAGTQVSRGDAPSGDSDSDALLRHWELAWKSLDKVQRIGRGSCGTVWEGRWLCARVAIKEFDMTLACDDAENESYREMAASFRGEVERLCKLRHPNVLAFYGAVTQPPSLCIVTELMACDLRQYLQRDARAAVLVQRLAVAKGCACGLLYLHCQAPPVVHRDVKPENFLMSAAGEVKVCDFGLARDRHGTRLNTLHHGGTLCYIAPEVHRGQDFDESCDVYALAVVLWELVTLAFPFHDKPPQAIPGIVGWGAERPSMQSLQESAQQKAGTVEGQVLESLTTLINSSWGQDPKKRLTCMEVYKRLDSCLDSLSSIAGDR